MSEQSILTSFNRSFWLVNMMELFERGAYYGMNSVLAVYLTNKVAEGGLGFSEVSVGFLQAIVYCLTYIIPILGGALAEKYGYRRMLSVAFCLLSAGYFAAGFFTSYGAIFAALAIMAAGSGLFKPIVSGTIARTTTEQNSGFGFGIYYWMINLGAFFAPIIVSVIKGFSWRYVFIASALYTAAMLLPTLILFKDPELPGKAVSLRKTAENALMVLGDARFMLLIFVYSFFWILYFQSFGTVLWYLRDFIDKSAVNAFMAKFLGQGFDFGEEFVTTINAGTIILLQVLISRLVKNMKAIPTMCSGMLIGALGFLTLALTRNGWWFILGIVVFSIGEMTAHPKYYSYIGMVAPQDRKAVYMGYAFLYGVIGSLFGSSFGAFLYTEIAKPGNPRLFFMIFFVLGILGFFGLIFYNRYFSGDTPATNQLARKVVLILYALLILAGLGMIGSNLFGAEMNYKKLISAFILLLVGSGGFWVTSRYGRVAPELTTRSA
jgi:dipeptide/tripeptide permease